MSLTALEGELTAYLDARMARRHVPGVAVALVHGDAELVVTRGITNVDHPLDVDERTLFQVGSRTKTFTTTALMRQVEAGALDLDAPLTTYLPNFALGTVEYTSRVTTRILLTHVGGWLGDYFLVAPIKERGSNALALLVEAMDEPPCFHPPGEMFSYNNAGFCVAGRLLEVLTGMAYEDAVQSLVLDPLGLTHTYYFPEAVITERTASGHIVVGGRPTVARPWGISRSSHPTGGIISDAVDQLRYARFHLGDGTAPDGTRLLSAATMADMQSKHATAIGITEAIGLPWMLDTVGGVRTVSHSGGMNGQMSAFTLVPDRQFAISVCTNADAGGLLAEEVAAWAMEHGLGLAHAPLTPMARSAEELDEYAGVYAMGVITVKRTDGGLQVCRAPVPGSELMESTPPPTRIAFSAPDEIFSLDEPQSRSGRGRFLRDAAGQITALHAGGRFLMRMATA